MELARKTKLFHFETLESTNDTAFELLKKGENLVAVLADWQSAGRGRNGKTWESSKQKNLLFSFGFSHSIKDINLYLLQVIGCLSTKKTLENYLSSEQLRLKYPNDVYASCENEYKKISGIISETNYLNENSCHSVIGIGVNIMQSPNKEEVPNAISLIECNKHLHNIDLEKIAMELAYNIEKYLVQAEKDIIDNWKQELRIIDKDIVVLAEPNKKYIALNILEDCRLLLEDFDKSHKIIDNGDSIRYDLS